MTDQCEPERWRDFVCPACRRHYGNDPVGVICGCDGNENRCESIDALPAAAYDRVAEERDDLWQASKGLTVAYERAEAAERRFEELAGAVRAHRNRLRQGDKNVAFTNGALYAALAEPEGKE